MTTTSPRLSTTTANPAPTWLLWIFRVNLIVQVGIVVTGGLVRLTGSGLGCPTWPECVDGSLVPTARQEEAWHKYVEFGNRTLTFLLGLAAIAALAGALIWWQRNRSNGRVLRAPIVALAAIPLLGTVAQAVLGGITVLTGLHPAIVAAHFLLSVAIIGGCVVLVDRAQDPGDRPVVPLVRREVTLLGDALVVTSFVVLVLGTIVTGAGPNSGDSDVTHRFGIDQRVAAWVHADIVYLFLGLIIAMALVLHLVDGPAAAKRREWQLVAVVLANGVLGYLQLLLGLPWAVVAGHMLLASLVWVAALRLRLALRTRGVAESAVVDLR
ncbi:MAG: COX15/CtaA family protein [Candidatus Nanopelagicales bacterium]